jgi:hypothetical protein
MFGSVQKDGDSRGVFGPVENNNDSQPPEGEPMDACLQARIVDWRLVLAEADEIQHFKARNPALAAESILRAVSLHGFDRRSVEAELGRSAARSA